VRATPASTSNVPTTCQIRDALPQEERGQHDPHDRLKVREDRGLARPHHEDRLVPPDVCDRTQQALEEDDRPRS